MKIETVVLKGAYVRLEPLQLKHLDLLWEIAADKKIWRWYPFQLDTHVNLRDYLEDSVRQRERGLHLPFVTIDEKSGKIVGSTRFMNIDVANKRVEIGSTWLALQWQRTYINTEAKLLMLTHAFENWECVRVELKTDALNEQSRHAILRLGAREEGILRKHVITESGRIRDTVYYSIINTEWPEVRAGLKSKLRSF
jgi:N-acetyltransferase